MRRDGIAEWVPFSTSSYEMNPLPCGCILVEYMINGDYGNM